MKSTKSFWLASALSIGFLISMYQPTFGQSVQPGINDLGSQGGEVIMGKSSGGPANADPKSFYNPTWHKGLIHLRNGETVSHGEIRYQTSKQLLHVKYPDKPNPLVISTNLVKAFEWKDEQTQQTFYFVNPRAMDIANAKEFEGYMQVHTKGEFSLYELHESVLKEGAVKYNDPTSKTYSWSSSQEFYLLKGKQLMKLSKGRKKLESLLAEQGADMKACNIKEFSHKDADGLKKLFECINGK